MNVTIKQLTYFREVARCGSFTDAANQLHTSQSNLSSSIRVLEELLGVRLINRTTKHFELTESGEAFLDVAERVLDDLENARSGEHTSELQSRGHLVCRLLLEKKKYIIIRE